MIGHVLETRRTLGRLVCGVVFGLGACAAPDASNTAGPEGARGTLLTAEEVRATFIGRPWKGSAGVFFFRPDGTYVYTSEKTTTQWGPWRYRINDDGTVSGASATYTFYRIGPGYRYHNSDTDEFYRAIPDTPQSRPGGAGRAQLETCLGTQVFCSVE